MTLAELLIIARNHYDYWNHPDMLCFSCNPEMLPGSLPLQRPEPIYDLFSDSLFQIDTEFIPEGAS